MINVLILTHYTNTITNLIAKVVYMFVHKVVVLIIHLTKVMNVYNHANIIRNMLVFHKVVLVITVLNNVLQPNTKKIQYKVHTVLLIVLEIIL